MSAYDLAGFKAVGANPYDLEGFSAVDPSQQEDPWLGRARAEIDQRRAEASQRGDDLTPAQEIAIIDANKRAVGARSNFQDTDVLNNYRVEAANKANRESAIRDYLAAPGQALTGVATNAVGLVAPETAAGIRENINAYYGTPQRTGASIYGNLEGGAANVIASIPTGAAGMAGLFGSAGAGGARTDIAERRAAGEDIGAGSEIASAGLIGLADAFTGYVGGKLYQGLGASLLKNPALKQLAEKGGKEGVIAVLKQIAPNMVEQGGIQALNTFADNVVKKFTYAPETSATEGVLTSGLTGAALAPLGAAVHAGRGARVSEQARPVEKAVEQAPPKDAPLAPSKESLVEKMTPLTDSQLKQLSPEQQAEVAKIERDKFLEAALTDEKTGAGNAARAKLDAERVFKSADETKEPVAVVTTDMAALKTLNDTQGHSVGDEAIKLKFDALDEATRSLMPDKRPSDVITRPSRIGGDEAQVILRGVKSEAEVNAIMKRASRIFDAKVAARFGADYPERFRPFIAFGHELRQAGDTRSYEQILKAADDKVIPYKDAEKARRGAPDRDKAVQEYLAYKATLKQPEQVSPAKTDSPTDAIGKVIPASELISKLGDNVDKEAFSQILGKDSMVLANVPLEHFKNTPPNNLRVDQIHKLSKAIKAGEDIPPVVAGFVNGEFRILDGRHRTLAARLAGHESVKAWVPENWAIVQKLAPNVMQYFRGSKETLGETTDRGITYQPLEATKVTDPTNTLAQRLVDKTRDLFQDPTTGSSLSRVVTRGADGKPSLQKKQIDTGFIEKEKIFVRGRTEIARAEADALARDYKRLKSDGFITNDSDIIDVLTNPEATEKLSPPAKAWAKRARTMMDEASTRLADAADAVGLEDVSTSVRNNLGTYLKGVNKEDASPTSRFMAFVKGRFGVTPSFGTSKHDSYVVYEGGDAVASFKNQHEAIAEIEARIAEAEAKGEKPPTLKFDAPLAAKWKLKNQVQDPRVRFAEGYVETIHNASVLQLFHDAYSRFGVDAPRKKTPEQLRVWAEENDLVPIPGRGRYHNHKNAYIPRPVAESLTEYTQLPSDVVQLFRRLNSVWKGTKTVLNPPTHVRNFLTNALVFSQLADTSPFNPQNFGAYGKAVASLRLGVRDPVFRAAVKDGLIGSGSNAEVETILKANSKSETPLDLVVNTIAGGFDTAAKVYSAGDTLFKLAIIHNNMRKGMDLPQALAETDKWMPNYSRISKAAKWMRDLPVGSPFISFFDQSMRIAGRASKEKKTKLATMAAFPLMIDALSRAYLNFSDEEKKLLQEEGGMLDRITSPLLPFRDDNGRPLYAELGALIPLANDLIPRQRNGSTTIPWLGSAPLARLAIEQLSGKELYTGHEFVTDKQTAGEQVSARLENAAKTLAPIPSVVMSGGPRVRRAAEGLSDESAGLAVMNGLLGIGVSSARVSVDSVRKIAMRMLQEGDPAAANNFVELWNKSYKPGDKEYISLKTIASNLETRFTQSVSKALEKAGEEVLHGNTKAAKAVIDGYNETVGNGLPRLTVEQAIRKSEEMRAKGRTR